MHIHERRIGNRFPLKLQGNAIIRGHHFDLTTHDVSQGGALVKFFTSSSLQKGTKINIRLNIGFIGRALICRINTHDNCDLYSVKFDRFDSFSDLLLIAYLNKYENQELGVAFV